VHGGHGEVPRGGGRGEEGAEPLGEGAEVRAEERVRCVDGAVVRPEAAVRAGEPRQRRTARQSVQQVRSWPRHPAPWPLMSWLGHRRQTEAWRAVWCLFGGGGRSSRRLGVGRRTRDTIFCFSGGGRRGWVLVWFLLRASRLLMSVLRSRLAFRGFLFSRCHRETPM
jgi:hypothetical protein